MGLGMFSAQQSPIAIDFGSSSVKLLQTSGGQAPTLIAATELSVPDDIRLKPDLLFDFYQNALLAAIRKGKFRGKRAVVSLPRLQTVIQHMQIMPADGVKTDDLVKAQLQAQHGCAPDSVVVRVIEVPDATRSGQAGNEVICLAIGHEFVMRYVSLLNKMKIEPVGVHSEVLALQRSFDHLHRRDGDENITTLYVDMAWGSTLAAISHGKQLAFARVIQVGGRHFDQLIAESIGCDLPSARAHRLAIQIAPPPREQTPVAQAVDADVNQADEEDSGGLAMLNAGVSKEQAGAAAVAEDRRAGIRPAALPQDVDPQAGPGPKAPSNVDFSELLDALTDELSMCVRYHQGLFSSRKIDRVIFLGGESRDVGLCRHIAQRLHIPAQMGDPLSRIAAEAKNVKTPGVTLGRPQPGWAVACGLCEAPLDQ